MDNLKEGTMSPLLPDTPRIERLALNPGDTLVVWVPFLQTMPREERAQFDLNVRQCFLGTLTSGVGLVVLDDSWRLSVLGDGEAEPAPANQACDGAHHPSRSGGMTFGNV
jgi:hypothetical protein